MIESIAISNFYCFNKRVEVSFVAGRERNKSTDSLYCGYSTINRVNLLKTVFLYGNNGVGKSKLLTAFNVLQLLVTVSRDDKSFPLPFFNFALDPNKNPNEPSEIELRYHIENNSYIYHIKWNERVILEERLSQQKPASVTELYYRWYDEEYKISKVEFGKSLDVDDDTAYIITSSLLSNNSIISVIGNTNIHNNILQDQLSFFKYGLELVDLEDIDLGNKLPDDKYNEMSGLKKVILALLKSIGSDIVDFEKIPMPKRLPTSLKTRIKDLSDEDKSVLLELLDMTPDYAVKVYHDIGLERPMPLDLEDESDGTKEILKLILCMHDAIAEHKTILLDDCINGIHPKTMQLLMKFYLGASDDSQLIIASQNFSNLDDELLRRDSLRFVKKNKVGETEVSKMNLGDLHKNQNLRMQIENSDKWGVKPIIDDDILEKAIKDYHDALVDCEKPELANIIS